MLLLAGKKLTLSFATLLLFLVFAQTANADRRGYVWTYEYMTMPRGQGELEYYLTTKVPDMHKYDDNNTWEHQAELEYGLTDYWDISVYQRWQQTNTSTDDKFEYTGTKLRTRYRIGEKGMYPVDTLLYMEYKRPDSSSAPEAFEGKLVLSKDIDRFNISYNQVIEAKIDNNSEIEHEYAAGLNYELNPTLKLAIESTGNLTEDKYYIGPTISWLHPRFWVGMGVLRGLNDRSDDLRARLIMGFPF